LKEFFVFFAKDENDKAEALLPEMIARSYSGLT